MKHIKTFERHSQNEEDNNHVGIDWQSDFSIEERDTITEFVEEQISYFVEQGYTSGELNGDDPLYTGSWSIDIDEDEEEDDDIRNGEIAKNISNGYTSGIYPTYSWSANVWK